MKEFLSQPLFHSLQHSTLFFHVFLLDSVQLNHFEWKHKETISLHVSFILAGNFISTSASEIVFHTKIFSSSHSSCAIFPTTDDEGPRDVKYFYLFLFHFDLFSPCCCNEKRGRKEKLFSIIFPFERIKMERKRR